MTITMYDAASPDVVANAIPGDAHAVAGYVGPYGPTNRYVTFPAVVGRFYPRAHCFSIAVQSFLLAACLDVETGDATPGECVGWFHMMRAHGQWRPCLYANASTMPAVKAELNRAGIPRSAYRLWVADWTFHPHIPDGYDACQWTDHGPHGENYDISLLRDDFFPTPAPPPPPKPKRKNITGQANFAGSTDGHHWNIHGTPGDVQWADVAEQVTAGVKLTIGGTDAGAWNIKGTPRIHPKVAGSSLAAALGVGASAILHAAGVPLSPPEASAISTVAAAVGGYLTPGR